MCFALFFAFCCNFVATLGDVFGRASDSFTRAQLSRVVSVDPVERLAVELIDTVCSQPQIAPTVRVDGHDALARKPVSNRIVIATARAACNCSVTNQNSGSQRCPPLF